MRRDLSAISIIVRLSNALQRFLAAVRTSICNNTACILRIRLSNALQRFLAAVRTLVSVTILYVSHELFRWFYNIFRLKVCAINCQYTTEWR